MSAVRRGSLFRHTSLTVASALIVFQLIVFAVIAYYVMLPMAKRSVDDLAGFIVFSAKTWVELPPDTRQDFELELAKKHNLWLLETAVDLPEYEGNLPYLTMLEQALEKRTGQVIRIKVTNWEINWFWVDVHSGGTQIRIGFPEDILGTQLLRALVLVMVATIVLTLLSAVVLARRVTRPLERMAEAARHIGMGNSPESLPETGAAELADLARTINQMSSQVQALLANRTTLLAGISHDLRTPLARMRIALEMLPETVDAKTRTRLTQDVEEMNRLIGEFLTFSRGLEKETTQETDLNLLMRELADSAGMESGAVINLKAQGTCVSSIGPLALRRILGNLISNAVRYGEGQAVEIECECGATANVIRILDRGCGIPAEEIENVFRPFYRLESSRSAATGGSGLGLAIAQQLASANGWTITLSPRFGGGTIASVTIRRSEKE